MHPSSWTQPATGASPSPCPATTPGAHPATRAGATRPGPPTVEEVIAVTRAAGAGPDGVRLRALIVVLWRAGLRIGEALALAETDLERAAARCWSATARATSVAR